MLPHVSIHKLPKGHKNRHRDIKNWCQDQRFCGLVPHLLADAYCIWRACHLDLVDGFKYPYIVTMTMTLCIFMCYYYINYICIVYSYFLCTHCFSTAYVTALVVIFRGTGLRQSHGMNDRWNCWLRPVEEHDFSDCMVKLFLGWLSIYSKNYKQLHVFRIMKWPVWKHKQVG